MNNVTLFGRISTNPEVRQTANGNTICSFSLVTNEKWTDTNGIKQEKATFHRMVAWGKSGDIIGQYAVKGQEMLIQGRIDNRSWDKPDGSKGYATEIIVEKFEFGQKPKGVETIQVEEQLADVGLVKKDELENCPF